MADVTFAVRLVLATEDHDESVIRSTAEHEFYVDGAADRPLAEVLAAACQNTLMAQFIAFVMPVTVAEATGERVDG